MGYVSISGDFGFVHYIGDAILVLLLSVFLVKEPFALIRDSFVELAGGTLQNEDEKENIEGILNEYIDDDVLQDDFISKTGSSYLVVAYLSGESMEELGPEQLELLKEQILARLKEDYPHAIFEIA